MKFLENTPEILDTELRIFVAHIKEEAIDPLASPSGARFISDWIEAIERLQREKDFAIVLQPCGEMIDKTMATVWSREHAAGWCEKDYTLKHVKTCGLFSREDDWISCMQHTGTNYANVALCITRLKQTWSGARVWKHMINPSCHHYMDAFIATKLKALDDKRLTKDSLKACWAECKAEAITHGMLEVIDKDKTAMCLYLRVLLAALFARPVCLNSHSIDSARSIRDFFNVFMFRLQVHGASYRVDLNWRGNA